jgi:hypothetical protein
MRRSQPKITLDLSIGDIEFGHEGVATSGVGTRWMRPVFLPLMARRGLMVVGMLGDCRLSNLLDSLAPDWLRASDRNDADGERSRTSGVKL